MEDYSKKYEKLLNPEESYQFLLKVQKDIIRLARNKNIKEFYNLLSFSMNHLNKNKEAESCNSLIFFSLSQYTTYIKKIENIDEFIINFKKYFDLIPDNCDKNPFKKEFLKFLEINKISSVQIQKYKIYSIFAIDSLKNVTLQNLVEGYKYALKSEELDIIEKMIEIVLNSKEYIKSEKEKEFIITRTTFELILKKNLKVAFDFISNHINKNDDFKNNSPVLNFAYMLVSLITLSLHDFDKFWDLINIYKPVIEQEYFFQMYLNKISDVYYNKTFLKNDNFDMMNMLKSFGNLGNLFNGR